ncbi:MAG TPA: TrbI/VirB10 family protein [Candidatus Acidoferrales bacterium]|nr:TrbI/VirB10 family protein [Candidatus Acidoferrales bacterium]
MRRRESLPLLMLGATLGCYGVLSAQNAPPGPTQPPAPPPALAQQPAGAAPAPPQPVGAAPAAETKQIQVPVGTHLPLVLHNGISTRNAKPGDPVYLETVYPILVDSRIVIPAGTYVSGEITEAKRPGRVKGRGEIMLRLTNMILPNGYAVSLLATPNDASDGGADTVDKEGKIKGNTNKSGDARTIGETTAGGATIGAITGGAKGAGIGAGVGAAVGLAAVMLTRGPEVNLPRGTSLDVVLDRPILLDSARVQFTDLGRATSLAGPRSH